MAISKRNAEEGMRSASGRGKISKFSASSCLTHPTGASGVKAHDKEVQAVEASQSEKQHTVPFLVVFFPIINDI